jgi:hypothetical protein
VAGGRVDTIDYVTINSTGNATDFGNLTQAKDSVAGTSSSTRGVFGGGYNGGELNTIEYITIASTGNGTDFGDLSGIARTAATSNSVIALFMGDIVGNLDGIEKVTIATTGNSTDFGNLTADIAQGAACSSAHGGL